MTNGNGLAIRQPTAADAPACDEVVRGLPYPFEASSEITWMAVHAGHRDRRVGRTLIRRLTGQLRAEGRRLLLAMPLDAQAAAADGTTRRAMTRRQPGIRWAYLAVGVSLVAFAVLGAGLLMAAMGSLAGLPGPATPGGFRDNDLAAVATCFGALALVFAYASYRSMRR